MIKHWRLFDTITEQQLKQLDSVGIYVKIEDDVSELDFPIYGKVPFVKSQDIYISTTKESQETLLHLMFADTVRPIGYENDREYTRP
jgi:hypothetical protein